MTLTKKIDKSHGNAFSIPAVGIQIRQQSEKQMRNAMTRVNQEQASCTKTDQIKQYKMARASI